MGGFFSMNNPFFQALGKIANCVFLSILWLIFCIPLFTAGASTAAMYYTVQKCLKNDRGYVFSCFWESFKDNFKTSLPIDLIFLLIFFIGITDISVLDYLGENGMSYSALTVIFWVLMFLALLYAVWCFSTLARFKNKWKQVMKNSLLMATGHWPMSLAIAGILAFTVLLIYLVPVSVCIMPVVGVWLMSIFTEKVFRLYMKREDKILDDELNMVWHNDYEEKEGEKEKKDKKST